MIAKDTTTTVNFFVTDTDGFPSTGQASNITATISINGATATAISDTITEKGSGWYYFTHTFGTVGNVFIEFSATNCTIEPWEDDVINMAGSAPSASDIALAVWSYEDENNILYPCRSIQMVEVGNTLYTPMVEGLYGGYDALVNAIWGFNPATLLSQTSAALRLVDIQDNAARPGDAMTLTAAYNAAKTASQFNASTDTVTINSVQAATMTTATGFATPNDIPSASTIATAVWSDTTIYTGNSKGNRLSGIYNTAQNIPGMVWMVSADYGDGIQNTMGQAIYNLFNDHATATNVTNAQTAIIAAMPDVSGLSTFNSATDKVTLNTTEDGTLSAIKSKVDTLQNTDISTLAKSSELAGLSTFNASVDKVTLNSTEDSTLSAIKTKVDSLNNTDVSSLATKTDLNNAQIAIVGAIPTVPTDYAKEGDTMALSATDIASIKDGLATGSNVSDAQSAIINAMPDISSLSTFNPATDSVQLDSTQLDTLATGSEVSDAKDDIIAALADIDIDTSDLAKATDVAVVADMVKQLDAGVLHWSTTATQLTLYKEDNTVLRLYSLERDAEGNITRISPINA